MQAFILAGGFATRLWPLTERRAKPLLPLRGKPILSHLLERIPPHIPVTISTNAAFAEGFERWMATIGRPRMRLMIEHTHRDDQKMGALGATAEWVARERIDEDVLLLTGDNYLGFTMGRFLEAFRDGVALLAAYDIKDREKASAFGTVMVDPQSAGKVRKIIGFEEKPRNPKTSLVSTGCSIVPRTVLPVLREYAENHPDNVGGLFEELLRRNFPLDCFTFTEPWLDIGSFASYLEAHRLLVGKAIVADPRASIAASVCEGSIAVGAGSRIEQSELTDCIVFENCKIHNCMLRNCIVDDGCLLRNIDLSDKMLRAGTVLERSGMSL